MKVEDYKSGVYKNQRGYRSFSPTLVNSAWTWEDGRINTLLEQASTALAELNAYSLIVPDIDLFIHMHIRKEADTSSRIEGTQTTFNENLMAEEAIPLEKRDDWHEVNNYTEAMKQAVERLDSLPLSNRLVKETHAILMRGVPGQSKSPGEFRRSQNWIGGASLEDAFFIPPHHNEVQVLVSDLEKFWHNENIQVPHLIRIAISHYQFETIHPFLDGNGRMGRLLITLYLIDKRLLLKPSLYLSAYLEKNKGAYFDSLTVARASSDLSQWIRFFLVAIRETANKGKATFEKILRLRESLTQSVLTLGKRASNGNKLLNLLYAEPFISISEAANRLGVTHQTASSLIKKFVELDILDEFPESRRNRIFVFGKYLDLFVD